MSDCFSSFDDFMSRLQLSRIFYQWWLIIIIIIITNWLCNS